MNEKDVVMIGCFGKIPTKADFVGVNASGVVIQELDNWLQNSLLKFLDNEDWKRRFDDLPICFFNYHARSGGDIIGAMISSSDTSGRRYPFFIFQMLRAESCEEVLPFINTLGEVFAGQAQDILVDLVHRKLVADPIERLQDLRMLNAQDLTLYQRIFDRFLHDFSFDDIADALLWGWPEFVSSAFFYRVQYAMDQWKEGSSQAVLLPLPPERGLKRPVADLWQHWLGFACSIGTPVMSILIDDFMRPRLLLLPIWKSAEQFFEIISNPSDRKLCIDVLSPFEGNELRPDALPFPDSQLSLADFLDFFRSYAR